jgi:hypothetical protein
MFINFTYYFCSKIQKFIILLCFKRPYVPDELADWSKPYEDYKPVEHTSPIVLANPVWADPVIPE